VLIVVLLHEGLYLKQEEFQASTSVEDVHAFPRHIACDAAFASELVVPIVVDDELLGVLDLDSPSRRRFDADADQDPRGEEAGSALRIYLSLVLIFVTCAWPGIFDALTRRADRVSSCQPL
jgi:hypothetical protein